MQEKEGKSKKKDFKFQAIFLGCLVSAFPVFTGIGSSMYQLCYLIEYHAKEDI